MVSTTKAREMIITRTPTEILQNTDRGNYLTQTGPPPPSPRKSQTNTPYLPENADQQRNGNRSGQVSPRKTQYDERPHEADPRHRQNPDVHESDQRKPTFDYEDMMRERQKHVYGYHDSTAINPHLWENKPKHRKYPWYDHETYTQPGGFLFIRFDDSGYDIMNNALKVQESICRHTGGYLMGIAGKQKIFVYEMSQPNKQQNWNLSRRQTHPDAKMTENAVATFWFNRKEGAEGFFENGHRNQLREPCFPTPNGYEAFYVPLLSPPPMRPYNTFLFIEIVIPRTKREDLEENLTQFEGEMREDMSRVVPGCLSMVVSSQTGRVIFKPGLFISPYSKLFISRFESQRDVDEIMRIGMIKALKQKWGIPGDMNVFSMTIESNF